MPGRPQKILRDREQLRRLMKERGHDTVTLADATGLSKQLIGYLCSDGRHSRNSCSSRTAAAISVALGCPEDTLFCLPVSSKTEERNDR